MVEHLLQVAVRGLSQTLSSQSQGWSLHKAILQSQIFHNSKLCLTEDLKLQMKSNFSFQVLLERLFDGANLFLHLAPQGILHQRYLSRQLVL